MAESIAKLAGQHMRKMGTASKRHKKVVKRSWPMVSDALGVHPSQVEEFREQAKRSGLTGIDFREDGRCVISDKGQYEKYLPVRGVFNRDGNTSPRNL